MPEPSVDCAIVLDIAAASRTKGPEVGVFELPRRIGPDDRDRLLLGPAARQLSAASREYARAPLAQRLDVGRSVFREDVAREMVSMAEQRHLELQRRITVRPDDDVIERRVLESA